MEWQEAIELVPEGKIERFRWLCSEANPDPETRDAYRALMVRRATGEPEPTPADASLVAYVTRHGCGGC
jgi:hypothetical protein